MRRGPGILIAMVVYVVAFPPTACTVQSEEFLCEDALAKVRGCCGATPQKAYRCNYDQGCQTYPDIDEPTARCVIGASCSELQRAGTCGSQFGWCAQ